MMFVIEEKPLFRDLNQAIFWAWYLARFEPGIVKDPAFARFIANDSREQIDGDESYSRNLTSVELASRPGGLDAAAQAGMIKGCVEAMPLAECAHLKAQILRTTERSAAKLALVAFVAASLDPPDLDGNLLHDLVSKHYGQRGVSIAGLAKKHKMDRRKLTGIRRQVEITLDAISVRAETRAYEKLQTMGVVA